MISFRKSTRLNEEFDTFVAELISFIEKYNLNLQYKKILENVVERTKSHPEIIVIGEVNSGKSSLINALLGEEVCKVDEAPCTDCINIITYGKSKAESMNDKEKKVITLNHELLRNVSIIDTPGSNSKIHQHEEITRNYITRADLVFVIFSAKNPFGQSIWDIISNTKEQWNKNIVFVLQQSDLMKSDDLKQNINYIEHLAIERGFTNPIVLATSAKKEIDGNVVGSGFMEVSKIINNSFSSENNENKKLIAKYFTVNEVLNKISAELVCDSVNKDEVLEVKKRIDELIAQNSEANRLLVERYSEDYMVVLKEVDQDMSEVLHVKAMFKKMKSRTAMKTWFDEIIENYGNKTNNLIREITDDVVENKEMLNKHVANRIRDSKNEHFQVSEKELYKEVFDNHESLVEKTMSRASKTFGGTEPIEKITKKFGKRFQAKIAYANKIKWGIVLSLPTLIIMTFFYQIITVYGKVLSYFSEESGQALLQEININDVKTIISLVKALDPIFKAAAWPMLIIFVILLLIWAMFYEVVKFATNRMLERTLKKEALKAYDEFKDNQNVLVDEFSNKMIKHLEEVDKDFKMDFEKLTATINSQINNRETIPENIKGEFNSIVEKRDNLLKMLPLSK